jgi:hypothetical protein
MRQQTFFQIFFGMVLAQTVLLVSACTVIVPPQQRPVFRRPPAHAPAHGHRRRHVPPPHAAAHGHRHHAGEGMVLVFDANLAVYLVDGRPDYYYDHGHYFRRKNGRWQMCREVEGPWIAASTSHVPPKLVVKYQKKAHDKKDKKQEKEDKKQPQKKHKGKQEKGDKSDDDPGSDGRND